MTRHDAPGPLRRRGPRPLWLHLTAQPTPQALPSTPPPGLDPLLVAGIAAYRRHPYRRTLHDPPTLWTEGDSRLLDYGGPATGDTPPVLFVPSLINRAYVLDLMPERSMLRWLAASGIRPLLLDWGWPGAHDRTLDISALVDRLRRAAAGLPTPPVLVGYCMGGLLALAAATRTPPPALALLATPWDFHAAPGRPELPADLEPVLDATGTLPVDALQAAFATLAPGAVAEKFRRFAELDPASPAATDFVALEDWLNDGLPLAAPVARELLRDCYRDNLPARGLWRPGGAPVRPETLRCPVFAAIPAADRIVPPDAALPLATLLGATLHRADAGHIGMVAGPRAPDALWRPLLDWLRTR